MSALDEVRFSVQRSKSDFLPGILLNARYSRWMWVYLAPSLINGGITFLYSDGDAPAARWAGIIGVMLLTFALMFVAIGFCFLLSAFLSWRVPGALQPLDYVISDRGIAVRAETGSGESSWSVFDGAFENGRLLVIRQRPGFIHIIPKRALSADTLEAVRQILRRHLTGVLRLRETV